MKDANFTSADGVWSCLRGRKTIHGKLSDKRRIKEAKASLHGQEPLGKLLTEVVSLWRAVNRLSPSLENVEPHSRM